MESPAGRGAATHEVVEMMFDMRLLLSRAKEELRAAEAAGSLDARARQHVGSAMADINRVGTIIHGLEKAATVRLENNVALKSRSN